MYGAVQFDPVVVIEHGSDGLHQVALLLVDIPDQVKIKCGGRIEIIVDTPNCSIENPAAIEKTLHLGLDEESQTRNRSPPSGLSSHPIQLF
jgi:hypothetical protein